MKIKNKRPNRKLKINKVQEIFNKAIVERDKHCVICGKMENLQCSHFFPVSSHNGLRFHPYNAHAMCAGCHLTHHLKDPLLYPDFMKRKGRQILEYLKNNKRKTIRYTQPLLLELSQLIKKGNWQSLIMELESHWNRLKPSLADKHM